MITAKKKGLNVWLSLSFIALYMQGLHAAAPKNWGVNFQPAASPIMEGTARIHDLLLWVISGIALVVTILLIYAMVRFRASRNPVPSQTSHNTWLEIIWTLVPVVILIVIAVPSLRLLYEVEKPREADITIKAIGHQWYWAYEYQNPQNEKDIISFDSYMIADKDIKDGQLRLLSVDQPVVVPENTTVRVLVTAADVLHSFAVPSLGIKRDAVPGRINETWFKIKKKGTYYGQCSELCGAKHGFMPIEIKVVTKEEYQTWLAQKAQ